jgi:serine/threonine protein kinase
MGVWYLAQDIVIERDVALRVLSADIAADPELKQRFEREAKILAKLSHPNTRKRWVVPWSSPPRDPSDDRSA